jgi:hypothetical protein
MWVMINKLYSDFAVVTLAAVFHILCTTNATTDLVSVVAFGKSNKLSAAC